MVKIVKIRYNKFSLCGISWYTSIHENKVIFKNTFNIQLFDCIRPRVFQEKGNYLEILSCLVNRIN